MTTLIKEIPDALQGKRGWSVEINGKLVAEPVHSVRIYHPRYGELNYGLTPGGWDGLSFSEVGGGGSVIVLYAAINDDMYVSVVRQPRPNQGGEVLNVPRGFKKPDETHREAAQRELTEETGYEGEGSRFSEELGEPGNPNSAFFETWGANESGTLRGVRYFWYRVPEEELEPDEELTDRNPFGFGRVYRFREGMTKPIQDLGEKISDCLFMHWARVALISDQFSDTFVARVLATKVMNGDAFIFVVR